MLIGFRRLICWLPNEKGDKGVQVIAAAFQIGRRRRLNSSSENGLERWMILLNVNGRDHVIEAPDDMPLLWVLRDLLNLKGTKFGCGIAQCGACTVHLNGRPVRSCQLPVANVGLRKVTTIEGIGQTESGRRIQQAWLDLEVVQCGYCQSGQIMSAAALIERNPAPDDADIDAAMAGNICRCATYSRIRAAIKSASRQ